MDFNEVVSTRRSVRNYKATPVKMEIIDQLIHAASQAPSATNTQPWAFGVIQDVQLLKELSTRSKTLLLGILDQVPILEKYRSTLENPEFNIFYNASSLIVIYAKPDLSPEPIVDCALAAENLMLTARSLGLGSCWIGFARGYLNTAEAKQMLGVPDDYSAISPLIVGYPEAEFSTKDKNSPEILFRK
jgi:nitroreductase